MKTFTICTAMAIFAALSHAAPFEAETRQFKATIKLEGAPPDVAFYTRSVPTDGSVFYLSTSTYSSIPPLFPFHFQHRRHSPLANPSIQPLPNLEQLDDPLSISHINSLGGATCTFFGIDGSVTTVVGAQTVDVGPPQTQISGSCRAF